VTAGDGPTYGLVGALAAFPRRLAARAVEDAGGRLRRGVARNTTRVVVGRTLLAKADDGAVAKQIASVRVAGREVRSENGFLRALGLLETEAPSGLARASLLRQSGLPAAELDLLALFDAFEHDAEPFSFRDLILAKKYAGLIATGASWGAIARSVHRCGFAVSLTAKTLQVGGGRAIYARDGDSIAELDGQFLLGLGEPEGDPDDLFATAEDAEAEGRLIEAAALYSRCLALDPGDATATFNRGNCLRAAGRPAEAELDYARTVQLDPRFAEARFNLAGMLRERGRGAAARRQLEQAVALDPDYADAVFNLAAVAFELADLTAAGQWWERYIELDRDSEWARSAERGLRLLALLARPAG
jgi:tetratricopeptide (TPR) repeat protein